jgi:hypothetical protein
MLARVLQNGYLQAHDQGAIQGLAQDEVQMIRQALEKDQTPDRFEVVDETLILRFDRNESRKPLQEE